jgi:hypothetical protein
MKKLNKFERYVLEQGLTMWQEEMQNHIASADNQGRRSVFAKEYPPMVVQDIKNKLDSLTSKR